MTLLKLFITSFAVFVSFVHCSQWIEQTSPDLAYPFDIKLFENVNHRSGDIAKLSDYEGQKLILNFWYPSCPPCRLEIPDFESASEYLKEANTILIGIQVPGFDTFEDGQQFVNELNLTYTLGMTYDTELVVKYEIQGFPTTIFLNQDHQVVQKWTGMLDSEKLLELASK